MTYTSLAYLCYISSVSFHESFLQQRVEVVNELILLLICYHFVLFADTVWEKSFREQVGTSTISCIGLLLAANTLLILLINAKSCKLKIKAKFAKRKAQKNAIAEEKRLKEIADLA